MRLPPVYKIDWEDAQVDWVDGEANLGALPRCSVGFLLPSSNGVVRLAETLDTQYQKDKSVMTYVSVIPRKMIKKMRKLH